MSRRLCSWGYEGLPPTLFLAFLKTIMAVIPHCQAVRVLLHCCPALARPHGCQLVK